MSFLTEITQSAGFSLTVKQLIRYILVGITTLILTLSMIYFLVEYLSFHYIVAANTTTALIYLYSYILNKFVVFEDKRKAHIKQGSSFLFMRGMLLLLANSILFVGVHYFHFYYLWVVVFIAFLDALISFLVMKFYVFKAAEKAR